MTDRQKIAEKLSEYGLRPTAQRIAVYAYLSEHPTHPNAETIYEAVQSENPSFSRTTVYNSVHALEQAGLIRSIRIDATQLRYDATTLDHGHFRCRVCGKIVDFALPESVRKLCPSQFEVEMLDVDVTGVCEDCKNG